MVRRDLRPDQPTYDVVGIGNALVDVLTHESEEFIERHGLVKGSMTLIDTDRAEQLYEAMGSGIEVSGGSAANTVSGVASFGGKAAYIGRVFDDQLGAVFAHDLRATGVTFRSHPATEGPPTGRCLIVVTPDAQRTMNTYLGSSEYFGPEHVDGELIADAQVTFLEGYLFDRPEAKEAYWKASRVAHDAGRRVAPHPLGHLLRRAPQGSVARPRGRPGRRPLRQRARGAWPSTTSTPSTRRWPRPEQTSRSPHHPGPDRARSWSQGDEVEEVDAHPVEVVDTTGAGDLYAAGFLFGFTHGRSMAECGRLGSVAASAVLGHTGARPGLSLGQLVRPLGSELARHAASAPAAMIVR